MLGSGSLGQYALGEIGAAPAETPTTPDIRPTAWQEPRQTMARKVIIGGLVASLSAGSFAPPRPPNPVLPPPSGQIVTTRAIPTQFAFDRVTTTPPQQYQPWAVPKQRSPGLPAALQQVVAQYTASPVVASEPLPWMRYPSGPIVTTKVIPTQFAFDRVTTTPPLPFAPWAEPVRPKPQLLAALQQPVAQYLDPTVVVSASKQYPPWSEPRRDRRLSAALQQPVAQPAASAISQSYAPWPEPRRGKGLPAALQQAVAQYTATPVVVATSQPYRPLAEPTRPKVLQAAHQQPVAQYLDPTVIAPSLGWIRPPSGPIISTKAIPAQFAFNPPATVETASQPFLPWSEPKQRSPGLPAALQQAVAQYTTTPVVITASQPYPPWSEPRRSAPTRPFLQQSVAHYTTTPVPVTWQPWAEPRRSRIQPTALLPTTASLLGAPFFTKVAPWQEPYRVKPPRPTPAQNFYGYTAPPTASNFSQWYANLSEPQRQRVGLKTWLHMTTALTTAPTGIIAIMAATETNSDQAEIVYIVTRAVASAKVSIIEGPRAAAAASLRES